MKCRIKQIVVTLGITLFFSSHALADNKKYMPVANFNLTKFLGKWYEIGRLPTPFEKNLVHVTATYSLKDDGTVQVLNEGYKDSANGKYTKAIGKAKFADKKDVGYLKVSFFGPFYADYIIVDLDKEYSCAMVVSSNKYLWILCRWPTLDAQTITYLKSKAFDLGFDMRKLILVSQE